MFLFVTELLSHLSFQYEISNGKYVYIIMLVVKISQEEGEETEVVNVTSRSMVSGNVAARKSKQQTSSGKRGGTN